MQLLPGAWQQVESLFARALDLSPTARAAFLAEHCPDPTLRREVESLLANATEDDPASLKAVAHVAASFIDHADPDASRIGQHIGPYRIDAIAGHGGMGAVFLATRDDDQFHQRVAIKLVRAAVASSSMLNRLRRERQILARLEHNYIARLVDGGLTADGLPFLAMEFVDGQPVARYCDEHALSIRGRVALFRKICEAVEYAHRNLVIHRDLKPQNILVTADGTPKLLDFGIARLVDPSTEEGDEAALPTATVTRIMTPAYASPEQVRGDPVSTSSDVYSLGAVLYELLTGAQPHQITGSTPLEVIKAVCETAVRRPSTAAPAATRRHLAGDLDNIVLRAMHKEPARRYGSVAQLSEDLRRYLEGLPVTARPDTFVYRTSKLVRRHWPSVTAAAVAFLALAGGLGVALYEARIANARFQDVRSLASTFLFDFDKEISAVPGNTRARRLLVATAQKYLDSLATTAGNDEGLLVELATSYEKLGDVQGAPGQSNLGLIREAAGSYQKAIAILDRLPRKNPKHRAQLAKDLGVSARIAGELNQQEQAFRFAQRAADLAEQVRLESPADPELARAAGAGFEYLTIIQLGNYRAEEAIESSRKGAALYESAIPPNAPPKASHQFAIALSRLAAAQRQLCDFDAAEKNYQRALDIEGRILIANPADKTSRMLAGTLHEDLAGLNSSERYPNRGNPAAAITHLQAAREIYSQLAEADRNDIRAQVYAAFADASLALIYFHQNAAGDARRAEQLGESAVSTLEPAFRKSPNGGYMVSRRGLIGYVGGLGLARQGHRSEAIRLSGQVLDGVRAGARESGDRVSQLDVAGQLLRHAQVLVACGDYEAASHASKEASELVAVLNPEIHRWVSIAYQAGAYRFGLAQAMEAAHLPDAAANYAQAAALWSPWSEKYPHIRQLAAEAMAKTK